MILLDKKQCAEKLGVSASTFWRMRKDFPIKTYHIGGREMIEQEDLWTWFVSDERNAYYESLKR